MGVELGTPLMAWQQYVADVALEVGSDGRLAYREVVVSVMRQNGKTTLVLAAECARCLMWGGEQRVVYSAQTGKDARTKFKEDQKPLIEKSALSHFVRRFYLSDGNTSMVWHNGSRINVIDNTPSAGHGKTLDLAIIDEAFTDKDNTREQALLPTMATRPDPQIWNVSTAGTPDSTYLRRKVDVGRAAVAAGKTSGVAYFEWAIPEDEDIDDPAVWENRMPAFGVTIDEDFIRHARQTMSDGDFRRAIGNQWTDTAERFIPSEWWAAASQHGVEADRQTSVFAIDARADRSSAAIAVADADGNIELVAHKPDVSWVFDWLTETPERRLLTVVVDRNGPISGIADDLEQNGTRVERLDSTASRKACGKFYDGLSDHEIQIRDSKQTTEAANSAASKATADLWAWNREAPGGEILMAMSLAYGVAYKTPQAVIWSA